MAGHIFILFYITSIYRKSTDRLELLIAIGMVFGMSMGLINMFLMTPFLF
jgi:hypothetical protein